MNTNNKLLEKYQASMLLHGVGDAMGYKNGKWEFKFSGLDIHEELDELGGIENLKLEKPKWIVSDDTVLHLAVAECLINNKNKSLNDEIYIDLVDHYKNGMRDMANRAPGNTTMKSVSILSRREKGFLIPFNPSGGGCGASMRSSCIGLRYSKPDQIEDLVAFSIESGRMTHHHPVGYLGAVAAALFTSYALQNLSLNSWGAKFLNDLKYARDYIKKSNHHVKENLDSFDSFVEPWKNYLKVRDIENGLNEPKFPDNYGVLERDAFYKTISGRNNWAGALGIDSVLIAYDSLLGCNGDWKQLCLRAMLHGGDNDSTGCIAGSWYGALYGFDKVPENNYKNLEYKQRLLNCGNGLFKIQFG